MQEFFYQGIKRLDWGFGNPNITAGLIAILLMAVWGLAFIHRWGFWPALLGSTALGICLIQTVSRGGLVAAVLGGVVLLGCLRRPWPRGRWIPVAASLALLTSYAVWHGVATRYSKGIVEEDGSVSNRWLIYRMAPAMMVDAPGGWGHKRASEAFHHFYQPEGRSERYGSLVSSHLTWMTEWNWWGRIGYVGGWFSLCALCLPSGKRRWYAVALAAWVAFGVAAMLTTMANRWVLWLVPGILLLGVLGTRLLLRDWPSTKRWLVGGAASAAVLVGILIWGTLILPSQPGIKLRWGWVLLGDRGAATVWITNPDPAVLGRAYGQRLREQLNEGGSGAIQVEWRPDDRLTGDFAPGLSDTVVFSGKGIAGLEADRQVAATVAKSWILLNPEMPSQALTDTMKTSPPIRVLWGEFHPGNARYLWESLAAKFDHISLERVIAAGQYFPDWLKALDHE